MSQHATYTPAHSANAGAVEDKAGDLHQQFTAVQPQINSVGSSTNLNALEEYAERHSDREPPLLAALRAVTKKAMPSAAHMTSGPLQGRLLKSLVGIKGAKRVLEIGTFCGYSALCLAEGLAASKAGGSLLTLEIDAEAAAIARDHFAKSEAMACENVQAELVVGPAMVTLEKLAKKIENPFDMVFMDADKRQYRAYYDFLLDPENRLLAPGALLLCDNVLFKGLVLNSTPEGKAAVYKKGKKLNYWAQRHQDIADDLHSFNAYVATDPRTEAVLVPLRDGLTVVRCL